jgi:CRISPR system Cascade subunit CasB
MTTTDGSTTTVMPSSYSETRSAVARFVTQRVEKLQHRYLAGDNATGAAQLARLRRTVNQQPGESPDVWEIEFAGIPENLLGRGDKPSHAENAVHVALSLYACHQQSRHDREMHVRNRRQNLGAAVRQLMQQSQNADPSGKPPARLTALATAASFDETVYYARALINQLSSAQPPIQLDYGQFAADLFDMQNAAGRANVQRRWGRGFAVWSPPRAGNTATTNTTTEGN